MLRSVLVSLLTLLAVAALAGAVVMRERLPSGKPGPILPSAAGVVLGKTTKAQLLRRWGQATDCHASPSPVCNWYVGTGFDLEDSVGVALVPRANVAYLLTFYSPSWRKSRLRGWSLPGGVRIGSTFAAMKRAYPTVRWTKSTGKGSSWLVPRFELGGHEYQLSLFLDKGAQQRAAGRLIQLQVLWFGQPLRCTLTAAPTAGPEGEEAGMRVRGSCSGATGVRLQEASMAGGIRPLRVELTPRGGRVTSVAGTRCPGGPSTGGGYADCRSSATGWPVDVTLGFDSQPTKLEVTVGQPVGVPDGSADLRFTFP